MATARSDDEGGGGVGGGSTEAAAKSMRGGHVARSRRPGLVGAEARGSGEGGGAPPTPTRAEARCARRHHVRRRACARASLRARDRAERRRGEQLVPTRATRQSSSAPRTLAPGPHARARAAPTMATPESPVRPSVRPSDDRRRTMPEWPPRRGARGTRPIERRRRRPAAGAKIFAILSPYCSRICFRFERLQATYRPSPASGARAALRPPSARLTRATRSVRAAKGLVRRERVTWPPRE